MAPYASVQAAASSGDLRQRGQQRVANHGVHLVADAVVEVLAAHGLQRLRQPGGVLQVFHHGHQRLLQHLGLLGAVLAEQRLHLRIAAEQDLVEARRDLRLTGHHQIEAAAQQLNVQTHATPSSCAK
jgi:hypothetical protein